MTRTTRTSRLYGSALACLLAIPLTLSANETEHADTAEHTENKGNVTYIDLGPEGFSKITLPVPGSSDDESGSSRNMAVLDFTLLPFIDSGLQFYPATGSDTPKGASIEESDVRLFHISLITIPFFRTRVSASGPGVHMKDDDDQVRDLGLKSASFGEHSAEVFLDQPLFCLFNSLHFGLDSKADKVNTVPWDDAYLHRTRFLDTPVLRVWEKEKWPEQGRAFKFLKTPVLTAIERTDLPKEETFQFLASEFAAVWSFKDKKDTKRIRLLDALHLAQVYSYKRTDELTRQRVLRAWLVSVYNRSTGKAGFNHHEETDEWEVLSLPWSSIVHSEKTADKTSLTVVGTSGVKAGLGRNGRPSFALWYERHRAERLGDGHLLRIPFFGPAWATWGDNGERHASIFPNLFSHSYRANKN